MIIRLIPRGREIYKKCSVQILDYLYIFSAQKKVVDYSVYLMYNYFSAW